MVDPATRCIGGYGDVVVGLQAKMHEARVSAALSLNEKLEVVVFGHGGRDTNGWLALVEAVALDEVLRDIVRVSCFSCSWVDDEWEPVMARYVDHLFATGKVAEGSIEFNIMKYHEENSVLMARIAGHLEGKHLIVQCEQGVDMFVEPVTGEWLQDNYEDHAVHNACMEHAERMHVPSLLLQTNADLDLSRGIDGEELSASIFGGQLQTEAFGLKIEFVHGSEVTVVQRQPQTLIELACAVGGAQDKKLAFKQLLNFDPAQYATLSRLYPRYIAFSAAHTDASVPVAGALELAVVLLANGHPMTWRLATEAPPPPRPQWMLARFLLPREVEHGHVCVLKEFRRAQMHTAKTLAEYLGRWMAARAFHRVRRNVVPRHSRFAAKFWMQLDLGREIAESTRAQCPDFDLCPGGSSELLVQALGHVGRALKTLRFEPPFKCREDLEQEGRTSQADFGELGPLWLFTQPHFIHVLDFACRMLEAPQGIASEYSSIESGLPPRPGSVRATSASRTVARLLTEGLVEAWLERRRRRSARLLLAASLAASLGLAALLRQRRRCSL